MFRSAKHASKKLCRYIDLLASGGDRPALGLQLCLGEARLRTVDRSGSLFGLVPAHVAGAVAGVRGDPQAGDG